MSEVLPLGLVGKVGLAVERRFLVVLFSSVGVGGVGEEEGKCVGYSLVLGEVVKFEGDAVDSFVEDREGVEYVRVDEVLDDFAGLHAGT